MQFDRLKRGIIGAGSSTYNIGGCGIQYRFCEGHRGKQTRHGKRHFDRRLHGNAERRVLVWPSAATRLRGNRFIERWAGERGHLRQRRAEARAKLRDAGDAGNIDGGPLRMGQDAGLIHHVRSAADLVIRIANEAGEALGRRLPRLLVGN